MASRSCFVRLSRIVVGCEDIRSYLTALIYVSRAASLPQGEVHYPLHLKRRPLESAVVFPSLWKNCFRRKRLAKSSVSACISDQLIR